MQQRRRAALAPQQGHSFSWELPFITRNTAADGETGNGCLIPDLPSGKPDPTLHRYVRDLADQMTRMEAGLTPAAARAKKDQKRWEALHVILWTKKSWPLQVIPASLVNNALMTSTAIVDPRPTTTV